MALFFMNCSTKNGDINNSTDPDKNPFTDENLEGPWSDTLTVATLNMTIGFNVTSLIFINPEDPEAVYTVLSKIREDYFTNLPLERVKIMGKVLAEKQPDVVGLQEVMLMEWNDSLHSDFVPQLLEAIRAENGPDYQVYFVPLNDTTISAQAGAGSLKVRFQEGNAVLYKPEFTASDSVTHFYQSIFKAGGTSSIRGLNHVTLKNEQVEFQFFNTHLEINLPGNSQANQASEMRKYMTEVSDGVIPQIAVGDFNVLPESGIYSAFIGAGWRDGYASVKNDAGGTCCVTGPLVTDVDAAFSDRRIDYVFLRGDVLATDAEILLGERFVTEAGESLYAADHRMVMVRVAVK